MAVVDKYSKDSNRFLSVTGEREEIFIDGVGFVIVEYAYLYGVSELYDRIILYINDVRSRYGNLHNVAIVV